MLRKASAAEKLVNLNVDRQKVKDSPAYYDATTIDPAFEEHFRLYYDCDREISQL
jgi:hypothetical protein